MGSRSEHDRLAVKVPETLAGLLGVSLADLELRSDDPSGADLVIAAGRTFVVEVNKSTSAAPIAAAAKKVLELAKRVRRRAVPLVAVPFMGEVGARSARRPASAGSTSAATRTSSRRASG